MNNPGKMDYSDKIMKIEVITRHQEFIRLRSDWNHLVDESENPSVFLTHEWYSAWLNSFAGNSRLNVILIRENGGELVGIAPCFYREGQMQFTASPEVTDYCDFIIKKGRTREFLYLLISHLSNQTQPGINMSFINIPETSPTLKHMEEAAEKNGFSHESHELEAAPVLKLTGNFQDYLQSLERKNRQEMKRKARRLEKESGLKLEYLRKTSQIERAVPDFIRLHENCGTEKQTFWQKRGMKSFFRSLAEELSRSGMAELNMLYLNEVLIGALFNLLYPGKVYFYNVAYHPEYAHYSPGIYLFLFRIEKAIEAGIGTVDFLRGREKYKYAFGAGDCSLYQWILKLEEK